MQIICSNGFSTEAKLWLPSEKESRTEYSSIILIFSSDNSNSHSEAERNTFIPKHFLVIQLSL